VNFVGVDEESNGKWHLLALPIRLLRSSGAEAFIGKLRARVTTQFPNAKITIGCIVDMIICFLLTIV